MQRASSLAFVVAALLGGHAVSQESGFLEAAKFTIPTSVGVEQMGRSVAVVGSTILVGAPGAGVGGAVYVYERGLQGWTGAAPTAVLTASDAVQNGDFGESVAMLSDVIVVGAPRATAGGVANAGAAYVFERPPGGWVDATEDSKLTPANPVALDSFGVSVAIDDVIVVGSHRTVGPSGVDTGTAYVFLPTAEGWESSVAAIELSPSDAGPGIEFGFGVATSGSTILVGAPRARGFLGGAYIFEEPRGGWTSGTETVRLWASNPTLFDRFGSRVALDDDVAIIGAPAGLQLNLVGQAYVYERSVGGWQAGTETFLLTDGETGAEFGSAVAIRDGWMAVGAPIATLGQLGARGAVYVYRAAAPWTEIARTTASDGQPNDTYGFAVGVSDQQVAVGAPGVDLLGGAVLAGSTYVVDYAQRSLDSGCGANTMTLSGSRRLGGTINVSMTPCAAGSAHAFVLGVPLAQPFALSTAIACEPVAQCLLSCTPLVNLPGPEVPVPVPTDPAYVGLALCWQGICVDPSVCVRITDQVSATFSH